MLKLRTREGFSYAGASVLLHASQSDHFRSKLHLPCYTPCTAAYAVIIGVIALESLMPRFRNLGSLQGEIFAL